MSCKLSMNNSLKLNSDQQQWVKAPSIDTSVKLAGEEAKDRLYEPKHKKKLVRVLTVVAYVFFVSLAAIMLSLYYVFLWNGNQKDASKSKQYFELQFTNSICNNLEKMEPYPYEPTAIPVMEAFTTQPPDVSTETPIDQDDDDWPKYSSNFTEKLVKMSKRSILFQKIINSNLG